MLGQIPLSLWSSPDFEEAGSYVSLTVCTNAHRLVTLQRVVAVLFFCTHSYTVSSVWLAHGFNSVNEVERSLIFFFKHDF